MFLIFVVTIGIRFLYINIFSSCSLLIIKNFSSETFLDIHILSASFPLFCDLLSLSEPQEILNKLYQILRVLISNKTIFKVFGLASIPKGNLREIYGFFFKEMNICCLFFIIIVLIIYLLRSPKIMAPACTMFNWTIFYNFYFIKILIERQWHSTLIIQRRLLLDRVFSEIFKRLHIVLRYICGWSDLTRWGALTTFYCPHFSRQPLFIFVLCPLLLTGNLWKLKFQGLVLQL